VLSAGCASGESPAGPGGTPGVPQARLEEEFDLRIGTTATVSGEPLAVTFEALLEDSRCPTNVTCIREGEGVIRLRLRVSGKESGTLTLHTQVESLREGTFENYRVRFVRLLPVPRDTAPVPAAEYVATLTVSKDR
jgi:hypothetical protein